MDPNRGGLALMLSAFLVSVLILSLRSGSHKQAVKHSELDKDNAALAARAYTITAPLRDYHIQSIDNGVMIVKAGPSLTPPQLKDLARRLTTALHDADHVALGSDMVFVTINRGDQTVCEAQTYSQGIWVKLR